MTTTTHTTRTANHIVVTASGHVHYAADSLRRPAHILACNGRSVDGLGDQVGSVRVTCGSCHKGVASGRITIDDDNTETVG